LTTTFPQFLTKYDNDNLQMSSRSKAKFYYFFLFLLSFSSAYIYIYICWTETQKKEKEIVKLCFRSAAHLKIVIIIFGKELRKSCGQWKVLFIPGMDYYECMCNNLCLFNKNCILVLIVMMIKLQLKKFCKSLSLRIFRYASLRNVFADIVHQQSMDVKKCVSNVFILLLFSWVGPKYFSGLAK